MKGSFFHAQTMMTDVESCATINPPKYRPRSIFHPRSKAIATNAFTGDTVEIRAMPFQLPSIIAGNWKRRLTRVISFTRRFFFRNKPPAPPKPLALPVPQEQASSQPVHLPNPREDEHKDAFFHLIKIWSHNGDSPEEIERLQEIAVVFARSFHVPVDQALVSKDFNTLVKTIRTLRGKIGVPELASMVLLALIVEHKMYDTRIIKSDSEFFRRQSGVMGISPSCARDKVIRGAIYLKFRHDILEGVGGTPGISLEDFVQSHMAKLTLYERAVSKYGNEGALIRLKQLSFRDFQKALVENDPVWKSSPKQATEKASVPATFHDDNQKEMIRELGLKANEKRALQMVVRGCLYYPTKGLTEKQVAEVEKRLHQRRIDAVESNLRSQPAGFQRKGFNPDDPLAITEDLFELRNINDVVLRIRDGLALSMPARRTVSLLTYRLFSEKRTFSFYWKNFNKIGQYSAFSDFAMNELGMGEDYRDYLAVGKAIEANYKFLDWLTDMDTEVVFLKLRFLTKALETHRGNEPLVLARLRTLTVREFSAFSRDQDYEQTFSRHLTKTQMARFRELLSLIRNPHDPLYQSDFVEIYHNSEKDWVYAIEQEVLAEARKVDAPSKLPALTQESAHEGKILPEKTSDSYSVA